LSYIRHMVQNGNDGSEESNVMARLRAQVEELEAQVGALKEECVLSMDRNVALTEALERLQA